MALVITSNMILSEIPSKLMADVRVGSAQIYGCSELLHNRAGIGEKVAVFPPLRLLEIRSTQLQLSVSRYICCRNLYVLSWIVS